MTSLISPGPIPLGPVPLEEVEVPLEKKPSTSVGTNVKAKAKEAKVDVVPPFDNPKDVSEMHEYILDSPNAGLEDFKVVHLPFHLHTLGEHTYFLLPKNPSHSFLRTLPHCL